MNPIEYHYEPFRPMLWFFWFNGQRIYNPYLNELRTESVDPCRYYGFDIDDQGHAMLVKDFGDVLVYLGTGTCPARCEILPTETNVAHGTVYIGAWGSTRDGSANQHPVHSLPTEADIQTFEERFSEVLGRLDVASGLAVAFRQIGNEHIAAK